MKIRNAKGNAASGIHPKNRNTPAITKLTNASAVRASASLTLRLPRHLIPVASAAIPIAPIATVPTIEL